MLFTPEYRVLSCNFVRLYCLWMKGVIAPLTLRVGQITIKNYWHVINLTNLFCCLDHEEEDIIGVVLKRTA